MGKIDQKISPVDDFLPELWNWEDRTENMTLCYFNFTAVAPNHLR